MFFLYKLIGSLIVPPGLLCIVLIISSGAAFCRPRRKTLAVFLLLCTAALWLMSTPYGSHCITGPIESKYSDETLPQTLSYPLVMVLGGGLSYSYNGIPAAPSVFALERIICGIRIAEQLRCPILITGGDVFGNNNVSEAQIMYRSAKEFGWKGKTFIETHSRTTKENMQYSAKILKKGNYKNIILVTSAFHMPRSVAAASKYIAGTDTKIIPYVSGRLTRPGFHGTSDLLPDANSFMTSCLGIKEMVGLLAIKYF